MILDKIKTPGLSHLSYLVGAGGQAAVIATGGLASLILAESETLRYHEPHLTLIGLRLVFAQNT